MEAMFPMKILRLAATVLGIGILAACSQNEAPDDGPSHAPEIVREKTAAQALEGAQIPTLDPHTLNDAEIRKVIGTGRHCTFRYTSTGKPVVVVGMDQGGSPAAGVIKLNGSLVAMKPDPSAAGSNAGGFILAADPVRLSVQPGAPAASANPEESQVEAGMVFEVGQQLKVGYAGYLGCKAAPAAPGSAR